MNKFSNLYLLMIMTSIFSCQSSNEPIKHQESVNHSKKAHLVIKSPPRSFDPRTGADRRSQIIINMLFEGLTRFNTNGEVIPAAAHDITISPDQKTYIFKLRKEARWSNGDPVCAQDFEYAWKSSLAPDSNSFSENLYPIKNAREAKCGEVSIEAIGVRSIDPLTLEVELAHPAPYFLQMTTNGLYSPIPHKVVQTNPNWHTSPDTLVSNGPFCLAHLKPDESIELTKNKGYWDQKAVLLEGIHLAIIDDINTSLALYEKGKIDWIGEPFSELPFDISEKLQTTEMFSTQPIFATFFYFFNTSIPPFDSQKIRQAFSEILDRKAICSNIFKHGSQPTNSFISAFCPVESTLKERLVRGRELFQTALQEMGITKEEFPPITLYYGMIEGQKTLVQALKQQWEEAFNIPIKLEASEWTSYLSNCAAKKCQAGGLVFYALHSDPVFYLQYFDKAENRNNFSSWENADYQAIIAACNQEIDPYKREKLLHQAESILVKEAAIIPVYVSQYRYLKRSHLQGAYIRKTGAIDFKWAYLNEGDKINGQAK